MTLREYYTSLKKKERPPHPARAFVMNIAEKTGRSTKTVEQWIYGVYEPPVDVLPTISGEAGLPVEELFP